MSRDDKNKWIEKNGKEFFTMLISEYRKSVLKSVSCAKLNAATQCLRVGPVLSRNHS